MPLCSVLILCAKTATANSIAYALQRQGMETTTVQTANEALEKLKKRPADLVIVESKLNEGSGLPVLADVRRQFPLAMRMIYETDPIDIDLHALVNEVGPCAILTGSVDPAKVWKMLALEGPVTHSTGGGADDVALSPEQLQNRNAQLETENRLLVRELQKMKQLQKGWIRADGERAASLANAKNESLIQDVSNAVDEMMGDDVLLPVIPAIALRLQRLLADDNCSFEEIASTAGLEQGMSARILQVANSPVYAGLERIRNLQQAVARLGLRETRNLLQVVIAENLFRTKSQALANIMARLWMHSLCCAYSNEALALSLQIPESDDFFMMGLLHDVGKLAILQLVGHATEKGRWDKDALTEEVVKEVMVRRHNEIGAALIDRWQYPQIFQQVVRLHNDPPSKIREYAEPVIVTYFSNLLARKLGYSLVSWESSPVDDQEMAEALNMTDGMRLRHEEALEETIEKIKQSFFAKR